MINLFRHKKTLLILPRSVTPDAADKIRKNLKCAVIVLGECHQPYTLEI